MHADGMVWRPQPTSLDDAALRRCGSAGVIVSKQAGARRAEGGDIEEAVIVQRRRRGRRSSPRPHESVLRR